MSAVSSQEQLIAGSDRYKETSALPQVLLTLLVLMVLSMLAGPKVLAGAPMIAWVCMIAVFVSASAAFLISLIEPGDVTSVSIDKERSVVSLEQTGLFARSVRNVAFSDIEAVQMASRADKQGFETAMPLIILKSGRALALPAGTTEADIANMRARISEA